MGEGWPLKVAKAEIDKWCKFEIRPQPDDTIALWSPVGKKYVCAVGVDWPLLLAQDTVTDWCKFQIWTPVA